MPPGLRTELVDWNATPSAVWVSAADAPPGRWERFWHNPRPVTPLYADFEFGSHLALSEIVAADEYAALAAAGGLPGRPRRLYLVIDGFAYRGEPAPGYEWSWLVGVSPDASPRTRADATPEDDVEWQVLRRWQENTCASLVMALRRIRTENLTALSDAALRQQIRSLSRHLVEIWARYVTLDTAALVVRRRCQTFLQAELGTAEAELLQLLTGSSPATSEPVTRLDELARAVLVTPSLQSALDGPDPWTDPGIQAVLCVYLHAFGHRASEWEYIGPTLAERPERAVDLLREAVARASAGQPSAPEAARQRRDAQVAALRRRLSTAPLRLRFDHLLKDAQDTFGIHEDVITLYMQASAEMRYALLEAGARLAARDLLADRDHVFFLRRAELESALLGSVPADLAATVTARWSAYQQQPHADPPRVIAVPAPGVTTPGAAAPAARSETRPATPPIPALPNGQLRGLGASPGIYIGRARVIVGEEQFEQVLPGEVLVCPQTSPSWTILFGRIGALVTDDGGILSHPAIAAREFGLPAVVSTGNGTRALATGQTIQVDGGAGTVRVLAEGSPTPSPSPVRGGRERLALVQIPTCPGGQQAGPVSPPPRTGEGLGVGDSSLLWLGDPAANEIAQVGGKAAHLSRLAGTYRVPPGFCLTAMALEQQATLSPRLYDAVVEAYTHLARLSGETSPPVAVRSSAIDEDSPTTSFAGQHETYLNVRGAEAVVQAIVRCWQSLHAPRALEYRRRQGIGEAGASLAVLVQQLVRADAAAVVFSANPVTKSPDQVVVTASLGLGESIVGGSVSPDSYVLRKPDLASDLSIEMRQIATKRLMTVLAKDGTREVEVPPALQTVPAINDAQVVDAARLALDLEQHFGWPVDVECAWERGVLYLLQCRPITTL